MITNLFYQHRDLTKVYKRREKNRSIIGYVVQEKQVAHMSGTLEYEEE